MTDKEQVKSVKIVWLRRGSPVKRRQFLVFWIKIICDFLSTSNSWLQFQVCEWIYQVDLCGFYLVWCQVPVHRCRKITYSTCQGFLRITSCGFRDVFPWVYYRWCHQILMFVVFKHFRWNYGFGVWWSFLKHAVLWMSFRAFLDIFRHDLSSNVGHTLF